MKLTLIGVSVLLILAPDAAAQGRRGNQMQVWQTLAERYDKDKDGKLTSEEYTRGADKFASWDRNGDGVISEADFTAGTGNRGNRNAQANRGNRGNRGNQANRGNRGNRGTRGINPQQTTRILTTFLALPADENSDRKVSAEEWKKFCEKLDCDKNGLVTKDEMPDAANLQDRMYARIVAAADTDQDGKLQLSEVAAIFAKLDTDKSNDISGEELLTRPGNRGGGRIARGGGNAGGRGNRGRGLRGRGNRNARGGGGQLEAGVPRPGEDAPDFDLPLVDQPADAKSEVTIKLSSFKGKKPVALIFGSYT